MFSPYDIQSSILCQSSLILTPDIRSVLSLSLCVCFFPWFQEQKHYLVIVVMSMEKRFLPEDHTGQHATQTPHVQTVVIHLKIIKETKSLAENNDQWMNPLLCKAFLKWHLTRVQKVSLPGSQQAAQDLWSTWKRLARCTPGLDGKTRPNPSLSDEALSTNNSYLL